MLGMPCWIVLWLSRFETDKILFYRTWEAEIANIRYFWTCLDEILCLVTMAMIIVVAQAQSLGYV